MKHTINDVLRITTLDYLHRINTSAPPSPDTIEEELLDRCKALGFDSDKRASLCCMMRMDVIGHDIEIESKTALDWFAESRTKADGILANHPFGLRVKDMDDIAPYIPALSSTNE